MLPLARNVPLVLGRKSPADVVLDDAQLSRSHARLTWTDSGVFVEDLGSTNGTFVGGRRVEQVVVGPGDEILMGSVTISVHAPATFAIAPSEHIIVESEAMARLHDEARRVARTDAPVLITGETGVGKEVLAKIIHHASRRGEKPLRALNCGAIDDNLVQSQLFGYERGAFTGADRRTAGIFEQADGGTVFLDEIGELSATAQAALLRVLETKLVTRLGSEQPRPVDIRLLAATNRDLAGMSVEGSFRSDLYYRLNTIPLHIPPLRSRTEEIEALARHFLERARSRNETIATRIDGRAVELLTRHPWPGNVRELRNVVDRAAILARGEVIGVDELAPCLRAPASPTAATIAPPPPAAGAGKLKDRVQAYEGELILEALERNGWNQTEAARALKIPVRTLAYKIEKLGLRDRFPKT